MKTGTPPAVDHPPVEGHPRSDRQVRPSIGWVWVVGVTSLCVLAVLAARQRFSLTMVVGESMLPTLASGNLLLVDRAAYQSSDPVRGDIVIVDHDGEWMVKRVVGMPGEAVELTGGKLRVNGRRFPERYPVTPGTLDIARGRLGPGKFAVVGDNRSLPAEQLVHGVFAREQVIGKVLIPGMTMGAVTL